MKLHWSPKSPFVRKVMIVAHETGLVHRIDCVRSSAVRIRVNPDILRDSPVGRIPVLVLEDGIVLSGSWHICEYLDTLHAGRRLIPAEGPARWRQIELHGVADGLLDTLVRWRAESNREQAARVEAIETVCAEKTEACLDWLEKRASSFAEQEYEIGQIATGIALDYLDFRFASLGWRSRHPRLVEWHGKFTERPSSCATAIEDDNK